VALCTGKTPQQANVEDALLATVAFFLLPELEHTKEKNKIFEY
jgi:hypothetical protein